MKLRTRLALVVVLFISAFVISFTLLMLLEVPDRADAETEGALPWVLDLLPDRVETDAGSPAAGLERLARLVRSMDTIRHVKVTLRAVDGTELAVVPSRPRAVPQWLYSRLSRPKTVLRKDVRANSSVVAYFEVSPATADELAELWEDFTRSTLLVIGLALAAMSLIVWFTFRALQPLDRIRRALATIQSGERGTRLPRFSSPEMDEIATSFNGMADALEAGQAEREALLRKLIDADETTRRNVAHDLHDELSPYLVALQPLARTLQRECAGRPALERMAATVDTMVEHQSRILRQMRSILMGLHPPDLETLGLRGGISRMAEVAAADGERPLTVHVDLGGAWTTFGPVLDVSIYRLLQECLTNARRHADGPRVSVRLDADARLEGQPAVALDVGSEHHREVLGHKGTGLGRVGMRDRCIALGGRFHSGPDGAGHWRVHIVLPLDTASDRHEAESLPA